MPNIDREFVEKLDAFTDALGDVVELLKGETKKGTTDSVNKMLDSMPDKITQIAEDLASVKKDVKSIKTTAEDIKKSVDQIKKGKETGVFDKVSDPNNKQKIIDGIKVVTLIAGGVLAMGMAFKLIGKVDFMSVLALSAGIVGTSFAFVMVAKSLKDNQMDSKDILKTALILPVMALGLVASSWILKGTAQIGLSTAVSLVFVAGALGVTLFLLTKALDKSKLKKKHLPYFFLLPAVLHVMALGLVASSWILKGTASIGFSQAISIAIVSIAMGSALFFMTKAIASSNMKKKHLSQFLLLPLVLPAIALGLVAASWAFQLMAPISFGTAVSIMLVSLAVGIAMVAVMPALYVFKKAKIGIDDALEASVMMVILSGAIVLSSYILAQGQYDPKKVPDYQWSLKVGLSMVVFGGSVFLLGKFLKPAQLIQGGIAAIGVAAIIALSSYILSLGDYTKYPSYEWSLGTGLSMLVFGGAAVALGAIIMSGIGAVALLAGAAGVLGVAGLMVGVAEILSLYNWDSTRYPSLDWATSVGAALVAFPLAMLLAAPGALIGSVFSFFGADPPLVGVAKSMIGVAETLNEFDWDNAKYPTLEWALGVGTALTAFAGMNILAGGAQLIAGVMSFFGGGSGNPLEDLATSMIEVAKKMNDPIWKSDLSFPSKEWAEGVGLSLGAFANIFLALDEVDIDTDEFQEESILLVDGLKGVAEHMKGQDWENLPDLSKLGDWSENIKLGIGTFIELVDKVDEASYGDNDTRILKDTINLMMYMANQAEGVKFVKIPKDWSKSMSDGIKVFIDIIDYIDDASYERADRKGLEYLVESIVEIANMLNGVRWKPIDESWVKSIKMATDVMTSISPNLLNDADNIVDAFDKIASLEDSADGIKDLAAAIRDVADALSDVDSDVMNNLAKFSGSMLVLSLVDEAKLNDFIDVIDDRKDELKGVISMGNMTEPGNTGAIQVASVGKSILQVDEKEKVEQAERFKTLIEHLEKIDSHLSQMLGVKHVDSPSNLTYSGWGSSTHDDFK